MRKSHALWGVLLIFVGIIWILGSTNTVSIDLMGSLFTLWPILIIAAGITLFLKKEVHWVRVILWILVFALIGGYGFYLGLNDTGTTGSSNTFEMADSMSSAKLQVSTMAADLKIGSTDNELAKTNSDIKNLRYNFSGGRNSNIRYFQKMMLPGSQWGKNFTADLNSTIPWNLELNTGATEGVLDFSNIILNDCNINSAACDLRVVAGDRQDEAKIEINGASVEIEITIPTESGIRIQTNSVSSDVKGNGISLNRDGADYKSSNFNSAKKVIILTINGVSSNVTVNVQ